ncbi:response regulator [Arcobacter sp. YIC-464]|uniref:response regulator n=1 Tax=Arcobacter sp. YIC-464 TaxID=3376631 RepID=UPI003C1E808E
MLDEKFLNTLTILYVENDENLKEEFLIKFNSIFHTVLTASSLDEAIKVYDDMNSKNIEIDIVVSEANISDCSGLSLLSHVRKEYLNLPFIFFTETPDIEVLLTSLRQDVTAYFMKPLNLDEILLKIEDVCKVKKREDEIQKEQNEVEEYLRIINKVALVFIFDVDGNIVYVNDFLKEVVQCKDEEILGHNYRAIYHHEMPKKILEEQWDNINNGEKWDGKMKYLTKNSSIFYTNATILPVFSKEEKEEIRKFISVNFLTTKEENERREYRKKVLYNLQETKRVYQVAQQKIDELNHHLKKYEGYGKVEEYLRNQVKDNKDKYEELQSLENRLKASKRRFEQLTFGVNDKINKISIMTSDMKDIEFKATKKIDKVIEEIKVREAYILRIKEEIEEKAAKIKDLEDVVKHRTEQLVEKKG